MDKFIHMKLTGAHYTQDGRSRGFSQLQLRMRQNSEELSDLPKITQQSRVGWPQGP